MSQQILSASSLSTHINHRISDLVKRSFDIVVSLIVLGLLAPFFGLIAYGIKRDSTGPVFYRGPRIGRGGKRFYILKFRTMYEAPESYQGPRVTAQDDPRITRFGQWLRDTKLNELPQFWNVLKGEMSLVGPRPEDPTIAKTWPREVWQEILSVRPGITSPASVQYRNEESLLSMGNVMQEYLQQMAPNKMRLDQLYVRYRSFWLDLDVLLWTLLVLLPRVSSYTPPEKLLFVGPTYRLISRYMSWFSLDFLVTLTAIAFTGLAWRATRPLDIGWSKAIAIAFGFALLFSLTGAILGINRINWSKASNRDVVDLLPAWIIATTIAYFVNYFSGLIPSGLIFMASALALFGFVMVRYRSRLLTSFFSRIMQYQRFARAAREHVLIIGTGPTAHLAAWLLDHPENSENFWVVGFVDNDLFKQGTRIYGSEVVGGCKDISHLVKKHDVGVIILADQELSTEDFLAMIESCDISPARFAVLPDFMSIFGNIISEYQSKENVQAGTDFPCDRCLVRTASISMEPTLKELNK
jgi:lipopolysaccharide/colanic/teichoic acid biosynthesis glycosyltransferase